MDVSYPDVDCFGIWRAVMMVSNKTAADLEGQVIHLDGRIYPLASGSGELKVALQSSHGMRNKAYPLR